MQVTEFSGVLRMLISMEYRLGVLARLEVFPQYRPVGYQFDPLNVMLFQHGMVRTADDNLVAALDRLDNRNMLLGGPFTGVCTHLLHGSSAAN